MGFKIKIVKTEGALAKIDEIEILNQLAGAFAEHDGYCKSLFTEKLLAWVGEQIKKDFSPDLMHNVELAETEANRYHSLLNQERLEAEAGSNARATEIERLKNDLAAKHATLTEALYENKILKQRTEALTADLAELEDAREALANQEALIEELQKEKAGIMKAYGELAEQDRTFHIKLRDATNMVLLLKARLYDLEHPETAAPTDDQDPLRFPYQQSA